MDITRILEMGTTGLLFLALVVIYKLAGLRFPVLNGGGHQKRAADASERIALILSKIERDQKQVLDKMFGTYARREDGTYRAHIQKATEEDIRQTSIRVKDIAKEFGIE